MNHYKTILAYDGTSYLGWQKTCSGPTIQGSLLDALQKLESAPILPEAASRTDRGVHAEGQVVLIKTSKKWDPLLLQRALNAHLPPAIRIKKMDLVSDSFHPTLDAKSKEYRYRVSWGKVEDPMTRNYTWFKPGHLNREKMKKGVKKLLGTHDFTALSNEEKENPICHIEAIEIEELFSETLEIRIIGNRFLYKMARNIAGLLVFIGKEKWDENNIDELLLSKKRKLAPMTAPALGLTLFQVNYDR